MSGSAAIQSRIFPHHIQFILVTKRKREVLTVQIQNKLRRAPAVASPVEMFVLSSRRKGSLPKPEDDSGARAGRSVSSRITVGA
ncbi:hypothetical protein EMCG_06450 [[Emmonsia] crescens]|uniref:Uncharacterized protein n=1 Tax=[Emmonsia] crescens TaxID=73230 RepID=A0A0G2ICC8_9EURO|nr:hypothetical protein EMCG_06450 [Emmonsia crescens UAMH 3008]